MDHAAIRGIKARVILRPESVLPVHYQKFNAFRYLNFTCGNTDCIDFCGQYYGVGERAPLV